MPYLPELPTWEKSVINTQQFLGLNRGLSIADGEMADMVNMSSDNFPVLSTRPPRGVPNFDDRAEIEPVFAGEIGGMLGNDRLVVCSDGEVYLDGVKVPIELSTEGKYREKKLVANGAYVCIWPDKMYFNVNNMDDCGPMGSRWTAAEGETITAMMCRLDGTDYDMTQIVIGSLPPEEPKDLDFWLDTSGDKDVLKQYSAIHLQWVQVATTYIKIQSQGIGKGIKVGDAIWLDGVREINESGEPDNETDIPEAIERIYPGKDVTLASHYEVSVDQNYYYVYGTPSEEKDTQTIKISGLTNNQRAVRAYVKFTSSGITSTNGIGMESDQDFQEYRIATVNGKSFDPSAGEKSVPIEVNGENVNIQIVYQGENNTKKKYSQKQILELTNLRIELIIDEEDSDSANRKELKRLNAANLVYGCGDDYIIVAGILHNEVTLENTLVAEMRIPDLDYVCEANNRIWGCRYQEADGTVVNELRCCALGDFRNWYKFQGTAADSYTVTLGSDGIFTGAFSHQGRPLFFKESYIHKVTGTVPANYTMVTLQGRGVQDGSWKSLAVVNETLFYKSRNDIMAYEGAMPYAVSQKLGQALYKNAVAGGYRDKYYICMQDERLTWHTYVLDAGKGLWHREDGKQITHMASAGGELVLACKDGDTTQLRTVAGTNQEEGVFEWSVTFGVLGYQSEQQKYLSRYNIRAQMSSGGHMKVEMQYDSDGKWVHMGTLKSPRLRTFLLPIIPRRCDHCQLRISGKGAVNIYSVAREYENGGDG